MSGKVSYFSAHNVINVINKLVHCSSNLATLEQMKVLETITDDTLVILQIHKRVWPASQRDALFWSHMRRVPNNTDQDAHDIWIVCNHSTEHPEAPQV